MSLLDRLFQPIHDEASTSGLGYISDVVLQANSVPYLYVSRSWETPSASFVPDLHNLVLSAPQIDECLRELRARNSERVTLARQERNDAKDIRDFAFSWPNDGSPLWRIRANRTESARGPELTFRIHPHAVPDFDSLSLPKAILPLLNLHSGLIIIAGPTGGGKSTTIASLVQRYADRNNGRISTLEDPIEFLFNFPGRLVSQQWVPIHTPTWADGIHDALRRKVDLIVVGEMRERTSVQAAVHAASSGHLVIASCHPHTAVNTLEYLVGLFPPDAQDSARKNILSCLLVVLCQTLLPCTRDAPVVPWYELLLVSDTVRNNLANRQLTYLHSILSSESFLREGNVSGLLRLDDLRRRGLISDTTYSSFVTSIQTQQNHT